MTSISPYRFINGYRLVEPYFSSTTSRVPYHLANETLQDFISTDKSFLNISHDFIQKKINNGCVLVSNQRATPTQRLKQNDLVQYIYHCHEPEVLDDPVTVLEVTNDVVIVNKPCSIPVHPVGQYRKNTILEIVKHDNPFLMKKESHEKEDRILTTVHRLDRPVSGLLILARTKKVAKMMSQCFQKRLIEKLYIAKVKGVFPSDDVIVNEPIIKTSHNPVKCEVKEGAGSKTATTKFKRLSITNDNCSIVSCQPLTGVLHQIRTHLQWLGHPIVDDIKYGGEINENQHVPIPPVIQDHTHYEWCLHCQLGRRNTSHVLIEDLIKNSIHLHALSYKSCDPEWAWSYVAPPPKWLPDTNLYNGYIYNDNNIAI